jgi:putative acetyltransferase
MEIRFEQASDVPHVREVSRAAFNASAEPNLVDALRLQCREVISLVADDRTAIVGHILFSPVILDGADDLSAMALAPMAVMPARQRMGIGSALVTRGLDECRRRGVDAVFVVGHPEYYPPFGFTRASGFGITCEFDVADDAFMAIELRAAALRGRTGTIRYHEAFRSVA